MDHSSLHLPPQPRLTGFLGSTAPHIHPFITTTGDSDALQLYYVSPRPFHFPPSPPPTNSDPKRSIPLPSLSITAPGLSTMRPYYSGPVLDHSLSIVTCKSRAFETPLSPPPTLPTSTQALPPTDLDYLSPIPELSDAEFENDEDDDEFGSSLSLLGLPQTKTMSSPTSHSLLSPISPEWETSRISSDLPDCSSIFAKDSILLHLHQSRDLDIEYPRSSNSSTNGNQDTAGRSLLPFDAPGLISYPSPQCSSSFRSPASSTDMDLDDELQTPHSLFLENLDLAVDSDLFDDVQDRHNDDFPPLGWSRYSFEDEFNRKVNLTTSTTTSSFDSSYPSMTYPYPLSPSRTPSPSVYCIDFSEPSDPEPQSGPSSSYTPPQDSNSPALCQPLSESGLQMNVCPSSPDQHDDGLAPSSPFLRSASLPLLEFEDEEDSSSQPASPSQSLLALPGADVDDTLLPALDWNMNDPEPPSPSSTSSELAAAPFPSLLLFDDDSLQHGGSLEPEPDSTALFDLDISSYRCPHSVGSGSGSSSGLMVARPCWCSCELGGLSRLRQQYLRAEREARNAEGKMKAQAATARITSGYGYGWGVGKDSEVGDRARYEARKRVKREKERGREVRELVRLGMGKTGVLRDLLSERGQVDDGGKENEGREGEARKKKKVDARCVEQLVASMIMRRRDNTAYRPLTGWRIPNHQGSPLASADPALFINEVEDAWFQDDGSPDSEDEMVVDVGNSPPVIEEALTPRMSFDAGAMVINDDVEHGSCYSWLDLSGMHDGFPSSPVEDLMSTWKPSRQMFI